MSNPRRANGTKRDRVRKIVLREEDHCHLCDGWVDVRLPARRPGSPEVDEVVAVAHGGSPFDRANCRLSHRFCNRLRWHGPIHVARAKLAELKPRFDADGLLIQGPPPAPVTSRRWL